jgi:hypothetical protein
VVLIAEDEPGHLRTQSGVAHLDPRRAVFDAMLDGRVVQQRARGLKAHTIAPQLGVLLLGRGRRLRLPRGRGCRTTSAASLVVVGPSCAASPG